MDSPAQTTSNAQNSNSSDQVISNLKNQLDNLQKQTQTEENKVMQNLQAAKVPPQNSSKPPNTQNLKSQVLPADDQTQPQKGLPRKEKQLDQLVGSSSPESIPIREHQAEFEAPAELEQYMEKKPDPKTITLPKPVEDEFGDIIVKSTVISKPNIVLPLDESEIENGLHKKVINAVRWLATWCKRNILVNPGRVFYNKKKQ
jgi:hypothetical protein